MGGLEVKSQKEGWIQATPVEGSILVNSTYVVILCKKERKCSDILLQLNMGDMMEALTGGLFPATRHRVVIPEEETTRRKSRQSFVFFAMADDHTVLKPAVEAVTEKYKNKEPITAKRLLEERLSATFVDYEPTIL